MMRQRVTAQRVLIVRPSAIGDIAMASPMLRTLKKCLPEARVFWLVEQGMQPVLTHNNRLDELLVWAKNDWKKLLKSGNLLALTKEIIAFRNELREADFDLVLDAQGLFRSRLLCWLTRAPLKIGFESGEPGAFLMDRIVPRGGDGDRMSSEYKYLMEELGLETGAFHQCLEVSSEDEEQARKALQTADIAGTFAAAAPFTTRPQKHWFPERWVAFARRMKDEFNLPVVLLGGPGDEAAAEEIRQAAEGAAYSLAGKLSLSASMAILKHASLLVGVDTGLTHMGPAFRRPTIALFGATCPYLYTSRDCSRVIYHSRECSPCKRKPTCDEAFFCMQAITVDEVVDTVKELVAPGKALT